VIKTVLTAAGRGTRLLPFTKEMPKEMMPIFTKIYGNHRSVIPLLQYIFEQFYSIKIRDYCFVVGRDKRSIKDHFAIQQSYLNELSVDRKKTMSDFYKKLKNCHLTWINQNKPLGFGDAVKRVEKFVGKQDFILHAGDISIVSRFKHPILRLIDTAKKNPDASAILVCKKVKDTKRYGIIQIKNRTSQVYLVEGVEEKPVRPKSNLGILALYYFKPEIFASLKKTKRGKNNELQLTDGIQHMINDGKKVLAIPLTADDTEIDVGTVESYRDAQISSYKRA
jgi:UTP--glucose-1-phosphate uridylyltransferase|tara:strand:- start:1262 stop:2101 length:840 start_codon:yes stop_codon:yes gene_type:complete